VQPCISVLLRRRRYPSGFVAQISATGDTFRVFALVALPMLFTLDIFTFVRLVGSAVEDIDSGRAINRIRSYYVDQ
jgi:hypothetical protein